jgi:hypothetical protein
MGLFDDELLAAIGAWQNGWREDQDRREGLASRLVNAAASLPREFRTAGGECFRKRFLHHGELVDIVLRDEKHEGVTSWTLDERYAERFKGLVRNGAVTAAIFAHRPTEDEVIVNIEALWANAGFVAAVESYAERHGEMYQALLNFRSLQGEVVLRAPLRGSEIRWLTGVSSPFDELCDRAGIPEIQREELFRRMMNDGAKIGEPRYTPPGGAQRALTRLIEAFYEKLAKLKAEGSLDTSQSSTSI